MFQSAHWCKMVTSFHLLSSPRNASVSRLTTLFSSVINYGLQINILEVLEI